MKTTKLQITKVWTETKLDESPDTSYLGEYSSTPGEHHIDREARGDCERGQFRYFNSASSETACVERDYDRSESLNAGAWHYVGIIAKCEVWNPSTQLTQVIRSGGLWGTESDSGAEYLQSVKVEELAGLRVELLALGLSDRAITRAFRNVVEKE